MAGDALGLGCDFLALVDNRRIGLGGAANQSFSGEIRGQVLRVLIRQHDGGWRHHRVFASPVLEGLDLAIEVFPGLSREAGISARSRIAIGAMAVRTRIGFRGIGRTCEQKDWQGQRGRAGEQLNFHFYSPKKSLC